jgi:hypothetical protein
MMAACSPRVSEVVASLPPRLRRRFHQAKALYRFLGNRRVSAEALLERVCELGLEGLEGAELLALLDVSPLEKPYARAMEALAPVGKGRVPGYELLTCLLLEGQGHLGLGYGRLLAYGERGMTSLPQEVLKAVSCCHQLLGGRGLRPTYVADRGFDDRKLFRLVLALGEGFVVRVYHDRLLDDGRRLGAVAEGLALPHRAWAWLKVRGRYRRVEVRFGFARLSLEGRELALVVSQVPELGRRGRWWLLTNLPVATAQDALRVVEAYRRRWQVDEFFRLLKAGLGLERVQVRGLTSLRKLVAVMLGLALFLWEVKQGEGPFKDLLLWLGGKLGLKSERDGPYLLMRGLLRLLNYEAAHDALGRAPPNLICHPLQEERSG